jgi:hypothetical protein
MIDLRLGRYVLGVCVAVAMLAGCGGNNGDGVVPINGAPNALPNEKTFNYTGAKQDFTVPSGVTQLKVIAFGAHGAGSTEAYGGRVRAVISVAPGEKLVVFVGGDASGASGGFNGGGNGGSGSYTTGSNGYGGGGGGASDVRQGGNKLTDRILAVGGGGGHGGELPDYDCPTPVGGKGGGLTGGSGGGTASYEECGQGGGGGTQSAGGSGGAAGIECYRSGYGTAGDSGALGAGGSGGSGYPNGVLAVAVAAAGITAPAVAARGV